MSENITKNLSGLKREDFQAEIQGKRTDLFILRNTKGYEVAITNYGGAMVAIMVPDRNGNVANVIMGHDNINDVVNKPEPFLSTLIGREIERRSGIALRTGTSHRGTVRKPNYQGVVCER